MEKKSYITSKWEWKVVVLTPLLYLGFSKIIYLNSWDKVLFTTFVLSLIWGYQVVENIDLIMNFSHKVLQKLLKNFEYLLDTMLLKSSGKRRTLLKKRFVIWLVSSNLWHGIKWIILENLFTTTNIHHQLFFTRQKIIPNSL